MKERVLEIIIDGYGFDPHLEIDILESCYDGLRPELAREWEKCCSAATEISAIKLSGRLLFTLAFNRNPVNIASSPDWATIRAVQDGRVHRSGCDSDSSPPRKGGWHRPSGWTKLRVSACSCAGVSGGQGIRGTARRT